MKYGICNVVIAPGRKEAADPSEMVTQLLFGETFEVLEIKKNWSFINTSLDDYRCWIDTKHISFIDEEYYKETKGLCSSRLTDLTAQITDEFDQQTNIVMGSVLPKKSNGKIKLGDKMFTINSPSNETHTLSYLTIERIALNYLNTPYLWGGRSPFGIDCSGFTQLVFLLNGFVLPRDSSQQAQVGSKVTFDKAKPGDLAFFHNKKGQIMHVGILLEKGRIIHASGKVRVDNLIKKGISNRGNLTHFLSHITCVLDRKNNFS